MAVPAAVGLRSSLPVKGIDLVLGNDLAGGREVYPCVSDVPHSSPVEATPELLFRQLTSPVSAGMVVVPKKNSSIRICVNLKPLNLNVQREVHLLSRVEDTLAQLSGVTVFSKLDANSGFWQIPLDSPSRLLTTFLTHNGKYCFNKLHFGIFSAPEHFQKQCTRF